MSRKPSVNIDYTSRDYESFRELMLQKLKEKMPEYTDTSETDAGIVILEALANGLDIVSLYTDIISNDVLLPTTQDRSLAILISKCLGYTPYNQTTSEYEQVFVLENKRGNDILIPKGTVVKTKNSTDLATLYFETMEDLIIPSGCLGDEKDKKGNYIYTATINHGTSVYQDVIGTSSGAPLQSFNMNYTGVLVDTIELLINEGHGQELWRRVDNFIDCDESSRVYVVSVDEFDVCTVLFGNGIKGKIPSSYPNGIIANYRIGGGEVGNVSAGIITELDTGITHVKSTFNLSATVLGHEKESLESIKENAPAFYRTRNRLVTLEDYEDLLRIYFYDFLRLYAERDEKIRTHAIVYYMMREGYTLTDKLESEIEKFISARNMVGTTYELRPYEEQVVNISAKMYVNADYDKEEITANVIQYLEMVTFKYGELVFKDTIAKSDLENEIKSTFAGILSFRINTPTEDIIKPHVPQAVLTLGNVEITSEYL